MLKFIMFSQKTETRLCDVSRISLELAASFKFWLALCEQLFILKVKGLGTGNTHYSDWGKPSRI